MQLSNFRHSPWHEYTSAVCSIWARIELGEEKEQIWFENSSHLLDPSRVDVVGVVVESVAVLTLDVVRVVEVGVVELEAAVVTVVVVADLVVVFELEAVVVAGLFVVVWMGVVVVVAVVVVEVPGVVVSRLDAKRRTRRRRSLDIAKLKSFPN